MKKEDKKPAYILCPRCELNYIDVKEKYCTVCKAEMGLVDPSILLPDDEIAATSVQGRKAVSTSSLLPVSSYAVIPLRVRQNMPDDLAHI